MKLFLFILGLLTMALLPLLVFGGCAQTTLYDRTTGKAIARFQGDMTGCHYADGSTTWSVDAVNHSTATLAQGRAAGHVINAIGTAGSGMLLSAGSSGLFPAAAGVAVPAVAGLLNPMTSATAPTPKPTFTQPLFNAKGQLIQPASSIP